MYFGVLGPLLVRDGAAPIAVPSARQRIILAALLARPNVAVPAEQLVELLWTDRTVPAAARDTLRSHVMRLRRALGPAGTRLRTKPPGYLIELRPGELDTEVFAELVGRAQAAGSDWAAGARLSGDALGLWRGAPFGDVPAPALQQAEVPRLHELRRRAIELYTQAALQRGRAEGLIAPLQGWMREFPLDESLAGALVRALAECGRQADALAVYRQTRDRLVDELGVEPGPTLRTAHRHVLAAAPADDRPTPVQLPADLPDFTGRHGELATVRARLSGAAGPSRTLVIDGLGGIGKSALAVRAAWLCRTDFPDGVLFANLRTSAAGPGATTHRVLARFLRALGTPAEELPDDPDERIALYRTACSRSRLLVVLDDVPTVESAVALLPSGPHSAALLSSRHRLAELTAADHLALRPLDRAESTGLLAALVGPSRLDAQPAAARDVVAACGGLPLALRIVAARLVRRPAWGLPELADRLARAPHRLDELRAGALGLREAFELSYAELDQPDTQRLFRLLGVIDAPSVGPGEAAALLGLSLDRAERTLDELDQAGLLREIEPGRYEGHDLVRDYARELTERHDPPRAVDLAVDRLLAWCLNAAAGAADALGPSRQVPLELPPTDVPVPELPDTDAARRWFDRAYPSLLSHWQLALRRGNDVLGWGLPAVLGTYFDRLRLWDDWIATYEQALCSADRLGHRPGQAWIHNNLAIAFLQRGRPADAEPHLQSALWIWRDVGNLDGEAAVLSNLARVHQSAGELARARQCLRRAVQLRRRTGHGVGLASVLVNLAVVLRELGELPSATECAEDALRQCTALGFTAGVASAVNCLGEIHRLRGELDLARERCQQALQLHEASGDRYEYACTLARLAQIAQAGGRLRLAHRDAAAALDIFVELKAPDVAPTQHLVADIEAQRANRIDVEQQAT